MTVYGRRVIIVNVLVLITFLILCVDVRFAPACVSAVMSRQLAFLAFGQLCCVYISFFEPCAIAWHFHYWMFLFVRARTCGGANE